MARNLILIPTGIGVGLPTITRGLVRLFATQGIKTAAFIPVEQEFSLLKKNKKSNLSLPIDYVERLFSQGKLDEVMEILIDNYTRAAKEHDVIIIQGVLSTQSISYSQKLNMQIARALDADIILVTAPASDTPEALANKIEIVASSYRKPNKDRMIGCIINKTNAPTQNQEFVPLGVSTESESTELNEAPIKIPKLSIPILGQIPWNPNLNAPRVSDVADYIDATVISAGEMKERRVLNAIMCARTVANIIDVLKPGTLVITAGDRSDVIIATCMAALNGTKIAALLLTGGYELNDNIKQLCQHAFNEGLPILSVTTNSFKTCQTIQNMVIRIPEDDVDQIKLSGRFVHDHLESDWVNKWVTSDIEKHLTPAAFRYQIVEKARELNKHIILPEGEEPRTIQAAAICHKRKIARLSLLGNPNEINKTAENHGVDLEGIQIIDPQQVYENYADKMVKVREHKGLKRPMALEYLQDNVVLGTMMLHEGEVDGLVSGALHTTANTIRPALQLIKTKPGVKLVSSVFFMCLPDQVLVYGDCAVNPDPTAEELADIAIQSADTSIAFGIDPRVAMISYSTGASGSGSDVEKVRSATEFVHEKRPDIPVDGPLQYDAALIKEVARSKAAGSKIAGIATVIIFPDLNTGNTTYKAVQRSANVLSIGPMLQGLKKPVNDLSRGATIDDIVYTIAITAIQAGNN